MKQGFSVFVMNWGDAGFKAIEVGRRRRESAADQRLKGQFQFKVSVCERCSRTSQALQRASPTLSALAAARPRRWSLRRCSDASRPGLAAVPRPRRPGPLRRARPAGRLERDQEHRLEDARSGPRLVVAGRRRRPRVADERDRRRDVSLRALAFDVETGREAGQRRSVPARAARATSTRRTASRRRRRSSTAIASSSTSAPTARPR